MVPICVSGRSQPALEQSGSVAASPRDSCAQKELGFRERSAYGHPLKGFPNGKGCLSEFVVRKLKPAAVSFSFLCI